MSGYYRKLIKNFSEISAPLTDLLKKDKKFKWTLQHCYLLECIKKEQIKAPVLKHPDYNRTFILETNASGVGIGAALNQQFDDGLHHIAFESKRLTKRKESYPVHELEFLAIYYALVKFRCFLEGCKFVIVTDHANSRFLIKQKHMS